MNDIDWRTGFAGGCDDDDEVCATAFDVVVVIAVEVDVGCDACVIIIIIVVDWFDFGNFVDVNRVDIESASPSRLFMVVVVGGGDECIVES